MPVKVSRSDVVAFRLHAHHLTERLDAGGSVRAAGRCGVQDSPPGSALLALNARVEGVTRQQLDGSVGADKTLVRTWCMRGAPFLFPAVDAAVFTRGVLPPTEASMHHLLPGVVPALQELDLSIVEAVALCRDEVRHVLAGRQLPITELGAELADRVAHRLSAAQRAAWEEEGPYAPGQPLGEGVVHFCVRIMALEGVVCFTPRTGNTAPFVLVEEWLGRPVPDVEPAVARAELLRRYLRAYGPSNPADFATWLGVGAGDAHSWWSLVEDELTEVDAGGRRWLLGSDLDVLRAPPSPVGVRLLPPRDPFTQLRDHSTILDERHHSSVWRAVGEPGTVLADGRIAGTWRPRTRGRALTLAITPFGRLSARVEERLQDEAARVAALRGASSVEVAVVSG